MAEVASPKAEVMSPPMLRETKNFDETVSVLIINFDACCLSSNSIHPSLRLLLVRPLIPSRGRTLTLPPGSERGKKNLVGLATTHLVISLQHREGISASHELGGEKREDSRKELSLFQLLLVDSRGSEDSGDSRESEDGVEESHD